MLRLGVRIRFSQSLAVREFDHVPVGIANDAQITGIRIQESRAEFQEAILLAFRSQVIYFVARSDRESQMAIGTERQLWPGVGVRRAFLQHHYETQFLLRRSIAQPRDLHAG